MKTASSAWVFTVGGNGQRGPKQKLSDAARREFVSFVSDPNNFGRPLAMPIAPAEVGIEFRKGIRTYDLFTTWDFRYFSDHLPETNDDHLGSFLAVLDSKPQELAQTWQKKYFPRPIAAPRPASGP